MDATQIAKMLGEEVTVEAIKEKKGEERRERKMRDKLRKKVMEQTKQGEGKPKDRKEREDQLDRMLTKGEEMRISPKLSQM